MLNREESRTIIPLPSLVNHPPAESCTSTFIKVAMGTINLYPGMVFLKDLMTNQIQFRPELGAFLAVDAMIILTSLLYLGSQKHRN